ncbi:hypothetical protein FSP39_016892 [Pinctada imbricata]|uniref:Uncharacterized protein n=1 Tax=Pinctada imbricata TaxID=66713 RepID=A0AA88Y1Q2_PINIB|nr:hypothetical protein FSP39_016892 [Pinctada imbricata]
MPGDDVAHIHETNPEEIKNRTANINIMLSALKSFTPSLITVCRSIRDGYTPRKHFKLIEKDILETAETCFRNLRVHYDSDLQGGKSGWRYEDTSNFDPY